MCLWCSWRRAAASCIGTGLSLFLFELKRFPRTLPCFHFSSHFALLATTSAPLLLLKILLSSSEKPPTRFRSTMTLQTAELAFTICESMSPCCNEKLTRTGEPEKRQGWFCCERLTRATNIRAKLTPQLMAPARQNFFLMSRLPKTAMVDVKSACCPRDVPNHSDLYLSQMPSRVEA